MNGFIEKIRSFMYGRNGVDKLSIALFFAYLLINGIKMFFRFNLKPYYIMWGIALVFFGLAVFRVLSKNTYRRQYENEKFEKLLYKIKFREFSFSLKKKFNRAGIRISQFKTHRFRTCPNCNEHLRMSKKRGKRSITCPKCGHHFNAFIPF